MMKETLMSKSEILNKSQFIKSQISNCLGVGLLGIGACPSPVLRMESLPNHLEIRNCTDRREVIHG